MNSLSWTPRFMISHNLLDYIPISEDIELAKIKVGEKLIGHSVAGIDFRQSFGLNIIALEHNGEASTEINHHYIFQSGMSFSRLEKISIYVIW